jgi:anti-anti-sigma factor
VSLLSVTIHERDPALGVVALHGEHDAPSSTRLENELALLLDAGLAVVVDLTDASFIDQRTLSVLLATRHCAEGAELGFTVVLPDESRVHVHRLLDTTGLKTAFAVFESLPEACDAAGLGATGAGRVRAGR